MEVAPHHPQAEEELLRSEFMAMISVTPPGQKQNQPYL